MQFSTCKLFFRGILLALAMLAAVAAALSAQVFQLSKAWELGRDGEAHIVGKYGTELLILQVQRGDKLALVARSDSSLEEVWRRELDLKLEEAMGATSGAEFRFLLLPAAQSWALVQARYERARTNIVLQRFSLKGEKMGEERQIFSCKDRHYLLRDYFTLSDDRTKLAFVMPMTLNELYAGVCDLVQDTTLWQVQQERKDWDLLRGYFAATPSNAGHLYLCFNENSQRRKLQQHRVSVWQYRDGDTMGVRRIELPLPDVYLQSLKTVYDERNGQLILSGFASSDDQTADGFLYMRCRFEQDSTAPASPPVISRVTFTQEYIRSATASRKRRVSGIPNLVARQIILRQDGGCLLIGEQVAVKNYELNTNLFPTLQQPSAQQADYWVGNVVFAAFHPDGQLHWKNILHKHQHSENDYAQYSSFLLLRTPSALRLLYNQDIYNGTPLYEYSLDALGKEQRRLVDVRMDKQLLKFRKGLQTDANEAFVFGEHLYKVYLVKIRY